MAALEKRIQAHEQRGVLYPPRVRWAFSVRGCLVIEIRRFECATHLQRGFQLLYSTPGFFLLNQRKNILPAHVVPCLGDERVAYLAHEHDQARRGVVMLGILPYHQNNVPGAK